MGEIEDPSEAEKQIAILTAKLSAHSGLLTEILCRLGMNPLEAADLVNKAEKQKIQDFLEFVEENDPSLAARIDERKPEDLI